MRYKILKRSIRYFFSRFALRVAGAAAIFLPLALLRWLGVEIGRLFYRVLPRYRNLAAANLEIAFPEKEKEYRSRVSEESFVLMGQGCADSIWFVTRSVRKRKDFITLEGKANLDRAIGSGRGVIGVTAHLGIFTVLGGALASYGYSTNYILRTPRDEKLTNILGRGLRIQGVRPIFTKPAVRCVEESISGLRHNEILIILIDQDMGEAGVFVKFFGRAASTPVGPVIFSLRTGAKIIPMFMVRENHRHKLIIYPAFELLDGENIENTILDNTQRLTSLVENIIREYPRQWSWIDRRWKTKPQKCSPVKL